MDAVANDVRAWVRYTVLGYLLEGTLEPYRLDDAAAGWILEALLGRAADPTFGAVVRATRDLANELEGPLRSPTAGARLAGLTEHPSVRRALQGGAGGFEASGERRPDRGREARRLLGGAAPARPAARAGAAAGGVKLTLPRRA